MRENYAKENFARADAPGNLWVPKRIPLHLQPYLRYCQRLISREAGSNRSKRRIFLGFSKHSHRLPQNSLRIVVQPEQTIASSVEGSGRAYLSKTFDPQTRAPYYVRLLGDFQGFEEADFIFDYSAANLAHVLNSDLRALYEKKARYIPPLIGYPGPAPRQRRVPKVSTMFGGPDVGRRSELLAQLSVRGVQTTNIFNEIDYGKALTDVGILLNYRQFAHFQTFEELRVLPALIQGCVVVNEEAPLSSEIPYFEFLELASAEDYVNRVQWVAKNYALAWERSFGKNSRLFSVLEKMQRENEMAIRDIVF